MNDAKLSEIAALKQRIYTLPKGLHESRQRCSEAQQRVKVLKAEVEDMRLEALLQVSIEKIGDKPRYTNDESRKAAVAQALTYSPRAKDLGKHLADAEAEALNADLDVKKLEEDQRAFRAVVDLTCAEISLLVAGR